MRIIRKSGLLIPNDYKYIDEIKKSLIRRFYNYNGILDSIYTYKDIGNITLIPRYTPLDKNYDVNILDLTNDGEDISIESNIVPRNEQQNEIVNHLTTNKNCILQIDPGSGKTVMSIESIARLKKKPIIFVHKKMLLDQWKSEILKFTNIKPEKIGRLNPKKLDTLYKYDIVLSTVQTAANIFDDPIKRSLVWASNFGIAIFDECHVTVGPESFTKASYLVNTSRVYALSATPCRYDNQNDILTYHLGSVHSLISTDRLKPKINMVFMNYGLMSNYKKKSYISWKGKFSSVRYQQQLCYSSKYMNIVVKYILKAHNEGRITLVLANIKSHIFNIANKCNLPKSSVGVCIPTASKDERLKYSDTDDLDYAFHKKNIVFATYKTARDGNSRDDFDCFIMLYPTANITQAVGRILRLKQGKKQPIVIDLVDMDDGFPIVKYRDITTDTIKKLPLFLYKAKKRYEEYLEYEWDIDRHRL